MADNSNATHFGWHGWGLDDKRKNLWMDGTIVPDANGDGVTYVETLYNGKSNKLLEQLSGHCVVERAAPTAASEPQIEYHPAPSATASSMPLMFKGNAAYASISLGTMPVIALIDTGATGRRGRRLPQPAA